MDIQGIFTAMVWGTYDSIKGMFTLIYLDKEMNDRMRTRLSPSRSNTNIRRRESDVSQATTPVRSLKAHEESKVLKRTMQCSLLNGGIFLASILLFYNLVLPLINVILDYIFGSDSDMSTSVFSWVRPFLMLLFQAFWVLPLFLLSKVVNCLWFQDIADSAYRYSRGRPQISTSISKIIADSLFSIAVQFLFLLQAMLVEYIPLSMIGRIFGFVHMCLLYSLYTFEYKWFNMGWELHKRLTFIEINWPYFVGFGLPLACLTQISDSWIINGCIFSITFPLFIISGNEANPVTGVCVYPLHLFRLVISTSNSFLQLFIDSRKLRRCTLQLLRFACVFLRAMFIYLIKPAYDLFILLIVSVSIVQFTTFLYKLIYL